MGSTCFFILDPNKVKGIVASSPITSWEIDGEKMKTVTDFIFLDSKISANSHHSHEIERLLLLGRKAMTNPDSILKRRGITLLTKAHIVSYLFQQSRIDVRAGPERRLSTEELMLLNCDVEKDSRVPWTARRSNQSILNKINPKYSLEGLMLKLKLQHFGHLMQRANSLEKTLLLGKTEGRRWGRQRSGWLDGITDSPPT